MQSDRGFQTEIWCNIIVPLSYDNITECCFCFFTVFEHPRCSLTLFNVITRVIWFHLNAVMITFSYSCMHGQRHPTQYNKGRHGSSCSPICLNKQIKASTRKHSNLETHTQTTTEAIFKHIAVSMKWFIFICMAINTVNRHSQSSISPQHSQSSVLHLTSRFTGPGWDCTTLRCREMLTLHRDSNTCHFNVNMHYYYKHLLKLNNTLFTTLESWIPEKTVFEN